jgi:hypothetical protein
MQQLELLFLKREMEIKRKQELRNKREQKKLRQQMLVQNPSIFMEKNVSGTTAASDSDP